MTGPTATTAGWSASKLALVGAVAGGGLLLTGGGVYASLNATASNTTPQATDSGTLSLVMNPNGAGFGTAVANLAPGDVVNRHIELIQRRHPEGRALTLGVVDATPSRLTTDATVGLQVAVSRCSVAWTAAAGTCSGTTTALLTSSVSRLRAAPGNLVPGTVASGEVAHLQIRLTLPNSAETTTNGVLPTDTIQGLAAQLTWTFN